jgi:hypothetical protein
VNSKHLLALCRRWWNVRDAIDAAYRQLDRPRWNALLRRETKLITLILEASQERKAA